MRTWRLTVGVQGDDPLGFKSVTLGPEYDDALRVAVRAVLRSMGARQKDEIPWVPDLEEVVFIVRGHELTVRAETYLGVSVAGPDDLVDEVAEKLKERSGRAV